MGPDLKGSVLEFWPIKVDEEEEKVPDGDLSDSAPFPFKSIFSAFLSASLSKLML